MSRWTRNSKLNNSNAQACDCLKNGFPQGSVLAHLLFNIYISDLPTTVSRQYAYSWRPTNHAWWWRLAGSGRGAVQGHGNCKWIPPDLEAKAQHYKNGVGGLPTRNKKKAKGELKVNFNNETLSFCSEPKYLGVMLDRSLTYRWNLESLCKKLTFHVALLRRAGATMLWIATLPLVHSAAEYCAPVWCCSAHTRLIDPTINVALRIVTGCLCPTPADDLPILAGIQPAELRRRGATLSLVRCA